MRAHIMGQEPHTILASRMSRKSVRAALLLGVLLSISIAVNALIILAAGGGA